MQAGVGQTSARALDGVQLTPSLPRTIVAFVGQNENGTHRNDATNFMALAEPYGLTGHVLDLMGSTCMDELRGLLDQGVLFAWGAAGVGSRLRPGGDCLWEAAKVPFISVHPDSPSWMLANHHVSSRYVANGYIYSDWLKMQRRLIHAPQISALLPHGVFANPARDAVAWSKRSHRMLFVKTGHPPAYHRSRWRNLPPRFRMVLEDASAVVLKAGVVDVTDAYLAALDHHALALEHRPDVLFGLMRELDVYIRDYRSTAMVTAVLDLPVDIVGRGWDHLERLGGKARFHKAVDASSVAQLYADTQFLLNTMPNFSVGTHERVLNGFAAKCCVVTNENGSMRERFGALPSYFGVDTEAYALADKLAAVFHDPTAYDDRLQPALNLVTVDYDAAAFTRGLIDLALEVRAAAAYQGFSY